jgi:type IV pilus assembly protein PilY1
MKISAKKTPWMITGAALALVSGAPAMADDTELLLYTPDPSQMPKPNVVFVLDTSGSMRTVERSAEPYDSNQVYEGSCDANTLYWTTVDVVPTCDAGNTQVIDKNAFVCNAASQQIIGIGSYTNTMIQYRTDESGAVTWTTLEAGNTTDIVECEADSGLDGDGISTGLYPVASAGTNDPYTTDPLAAVSWGSAPRNVSYTVYDGNYLNWKASPISVDLTRNDIMKDVTKTVLNSVNDMNVGVMRFNDRDGGPVIKAVQDLESNRSSILATIDSLPNDGRTPLSETMYENALYWLGRPAYYGEMINENPTDPAALASDNPEVYAQPNVDACAKNYNVLLTDGEPTNDDDTPSLAPTLPDFASILGRSSCTFNAMGDCLDDITEYLSKKDTHANKNGRQSVTTYTIGFTVDLPLLKDAAENSGGEYFLADDVESLTLALLQIIANISDRSLSFSAPAVSVNTFNRTQNLNDLFLTVFGAQNKAHWPGNLKKFRIVDREITDANGRPAVNPTTGLFFDSTRSFWSTMADGNDVLMGGAAHQLPDPSARNLYTNNSGSDLTATINQLTTANIANFSLSEFGLTGAAGEPTLDEMIRWMRGEDIRDVDGDPATTVRYAMGDPLHSQPAAIVYGGTPTSPDAVVYTATNDGYLHAVDAATGVELWSFIPKELLDNMTMLFFNPDAKYKQYGLDGSIVPVVKDENNNGIVDGNDFVYLIIGMRRGGNHYYALDVTNKNSPQLMWQRALTAGGQSWSMPSVSRMEISGVTQNADNAVLVVGGGYDTVHDTAAHPTTADAAGAGLHVLDLDTGNTLWRAGIDLGANLQSTKMTRAMPTAPQVIDLSGNGFADRIYVSDISGQLWRFDVFNGQPVGGLMTGGVIAQLGAEGLASPTAADTRRFYTAPDVSLFTDKLQNRRYIAVSLGSGYRAHPFDISAADRFFSVRDPDIFRKLTQLEYDNYNIAADDDLVEVSGQKQTVITSSDRGWKFTLPADQKVLSDSITFDNSVFFVAFSPDSDSTVSCTGGRGINFLYQVNVINGDPVVNNLDSIAPGNEDDARRQNLQQGGIAPTPTILFPSPDDADCEGAACSPPPIGCVGVECFDPGFVNNPVRTLWTQDGIQ